MKLTHLSLFSGIGGLDLAAEWAGFQTVGQCEWADYPTKVLEKHWPDVPRWRDIRTLTKESFYERTGLRAVDVISGGFPCQPFSTNGKRRGKEDDRYLWPEMLRVIEEIKPAWVVGENVAGLVSMAIDQVLSDLEAAGYETRAVMVPACGVDAPHRRYRVAILAYAQHVAYAQRIGLRPDDLQSAYDQIRDHSAYWEKRETELGTAGSGCQTLSDANSGRLEEPWMQGLSEEPRVSVADRGWWDVEPDVGRVAHGVPSRVDRLRCLGNADMPQQFYLIFQAIADIESQSARAFFEANR